MGNRGSRVHPRWVNQVLFPGAGGTSEGTDDPLCLVRVGNIDRV